jgi:hypothetical protein
MAVDGKASIITKAGLLGLVAVVMGGFFTYLSGDNDTGIEATIVIVGLILTAVLVGAAIALEAIRHHRHRDDDS